MRAVRRCRAHAKTRGSDITSKRKDTLALQKPEGKRKWRITGNGSAAATTTTAARHEVEPYAQMGNKVKLLLNITLEYEVHKTQCSAI